MRNFQYLQLHEILGIKIEGGIGRERERGTCLAALTRAVVMSLGCSETLPAAVAGSSVGLEGGGGSG